MCGAKSVDVLPRALMVGAACVAMAWLGCGGVRSQLSCPEHRTELDGVCVSESVADYVSCVRAQGAQLKSKDARSLSTEAGYAGAKAAVVSDVSSSLEKRYSTSDANTLEIIRTCKSLHESRVSAAPEPSEPGWERQGPFGAIAVSDGTDDWGWAIERASARSAEAAAMASCGAPDCYVVVPLQSACGAVVKGDDGVEYWSNHLPSRADAEQRALHECQTKTSGCTVLVWSCSF